MPALPADIVAVLAMFAPLFSQPTFEHVKLLLVGAILAPGRRTVAAALRIMGMAQQPQFQKYHRGLNRAVWSSRQARGPSLASLGGRFGVGPLIFGLDETLERRRGAKIAAKGIHRVTVRSSHSFFVKASGLRWMSLMLLAPIPWAGRVWGLPFLTVLAPSERYHAERGLVHKTLAEWAGLMVPQLRRWLPHHAIVLVADSTYAVLSFLRPCAELARPVMVVTRLRLDACLFAPAPQRKPGTKGRPRKQGARLPLLKGLVASPNTRWQMETTFQAVRTHLGVKTQRQCNEQAIARTTPALMGLFSLITLMAHPHFCRQQQPDRRASWYPKAQPTFADAIACVRRQIWRSQGFLMSSPHPDRTKFIPVFHECLIDVLCYAA